MNEYIRAGESFLKQCIFDGLAHSYDVIKRQYVKPYPEVSGYVIKYLCDFSDGYKQANIRECASYLSRIQHKIGGYKTFYDNRYLYAFDTAQILNGLVTIYQKGMHDKIILGAIEKAGVFLLNMVREDGAIFPVYDCYFRRKCMPSKLYSLWNGPTSGLMCKLTEVYAAMFEFTKNEKFLIAKEKVTSYYANVKALVHTHPLGYWLEGLYAGGEVEFVKKYLSEKVINRIEENGFIDYVPGLGYSYSSGEAQLGILLCKTGYIEEAIRIRGFLREVQSKHDSGGIFQYSTREGALDNHVHTEINSWGTKYYCELERLLENYE